MLKRILIVLICGLAPLFCQALPIDSLFLNAPDDILPRLDNAHRVVLLGSYQENSNAEGIADSWGGSNEILKRADSLIVLKTSSICTLQFRLLSSGDICVIKTISSPAADSKIKVYGADWNLRSDITPKFAVSDFVHILSADSLSITRQEELKNFLTPLYVQAEFINNGTQTIRFTVHPTNISKKGEHDLARMMNPIRLYLLQGTSLIPIY